MKHFLSLALMSLTLMSHSPAMARASVPIVNHENIEIPASRSGPSDRQRVQQAIVTAGTKHNWSVRPAGDGEMEASLLVRGKHTVVVSVRYTATQFSLIYKSSINMNFDARDDQSTTPLTQNRWVTDLQRNGQPVIHPNYNKWVNDLKQAIQLELQKT